MTAERESFEQMPIDVEGDDAGFDARTRSIAEKRAIGLTHAQIAEIQGVSSKTVARTLKAPGVGELVDELQSEIFSESTAQLLNLVSQAVETLGRLMKSDTETVAARAASKVIDMAGPLSALRAREQHFTRLVNAVEARLDEI